MAYRHRSTGDNLHQPIARDGGTTKYCWDDASVLLETDASGNISALNTIGSEIISREYLANPGDPNCVREKYYYLYDHLGNTRALTDGQGNLVQEYFYDVYGKCWNVTKDSINGYQYVGGYGVSADADDGLLYMRARYQDPGLGVFVSRDPITLLNRMSEYDYGYRNPVRYYDPNVEWAIPVALAALALSGLSVIVADLVQSREYSDAIAYNYAYRNKEQCLRWYQAMTGKFETCLRWEDIPHHWKVECGKQTEDYKRDILRETNQATKDALGTAYGP